MKERAVMGKIEFLLISIHHITTLHQPMTF